MLAQRAAAEGPRWTRAITGRPAAAGPADPHPGPLPPANGAVLGPANGHTVSTGGSPDLRTVARLTQWVSATVSAIGQERMSTILELYELLEQLPEPVSRALLGFARLEAGTRSGSPPEGERTPRSETLAALLELKSLLSSQPSGRHTTPFSPAWGTGSHGKEVSHR